MRPELLALAAVALSGVISYFTARLSLRAQQAKTQVDKEVGAGQMALDVAEGLRAEMRETKAEVSKHRRALNAVRRWWPVHERWDDAVQAVIRDIDPEKARQLPKRIPPPLWDEDI